MLIAAHISSCCDRAHHLAQRASLSRSSFKVKPRSRIRSARSTCRTLDGYPTFRGLFNKKYTGDMKFLFTNLTQCFMWRDRVHFPTQFSYCCLCKSGLLSYKSHITLQIVLLHCVMISPLHTCDDIHHLLMRCLLHIYWFGDTILCQVFLRHKYCDRIVFTEFRK